RPGLLFFSCLPHGKFLGEVPVGRRSPFFGVAVATGFGAIGVLVSASSRMLMLNRKASISFCRCSICCSLFCNTARISCMAAAFLQIMDFHSGWRGISENRPDGAVRSRLVQKLHART